MKASSENDRIEAPTNFQKLWLLSKPVSISAGSGKEWEIREEQGATNSSLLCGEGKSVLFKSVAPERYSAVQYMSICGWQIGFSELLNKQTNKQTLTKLAGGKSG